MFFMNSIISEDDAEQTMRKYKSHKSAMSGSFAISLFILVRMGLAADLTNRNKSLAFDIL